MTPEQILEKQLPRPFPAYAFIGPAGSGKQALARKFSAQLLQTQDLAAHPDFLYFDAGDQSVEAIREFAGRLTVKPFSALYRIAILDNAQLLNSQSANALLKTLEDPAAQTIVMLLASQWNLLPTVMSRCLVINFSALPPAQLSTEQQRQLQDLSALESAGPAEQVLAINRLAELEAEQLGQLLLAWLLAGRGEVSRHPQTAGRLRQISLALSALRTSANKKLVLQHLFITRHELAP